MNFSRILSANQPGAQAMASSLTGKVEQQGQQATSAIDNASSDFKGKVNAGRVQYQQQAVTGGHQGTAPTSADIYRAAGAASVAAQRGYSGPKDWKGAGIDTVALSGQAAEAQQAAQNLTTAGGRAAMLREGAGGGYSAGMSAMDSALAGAAMGSRGSDLASLYGGLSQRLIDAQAPASGLVTQATADSAAAQQQYEADAKALNQSASEQQQAEEAAAADAERASQNQETYNWLMNRPRYNRIGGVRLSRRN